MGGTSAAAARSISTRTSLKSMPLSRRREAAPAGGQTSINQLFRERLIPLGWLHEPRLFPNSDQGLRKWKMDFIKAAIGVEVSFNHSEAIPWTFTRLNIAGESQQVLEDARIDVGVAFFAMESLKKWGACGQRRRHVRVGNGMAQHDEADMPIPILVVGLSADGWPLTDVFRGTQSRRSAPVVPPLGEGLSRARPRSGVRDHATKALPIMKARRPSGMLVSVQLSGNPFRRSSSSGVKRRRCPPSVSITCLKRMA